MPLLADARRLPLAAHAGLAAAFCLATIWIPVAMAIGIWSGWAEKWTHIALVLEAAAVLAVVDLGLRARRLGQTVAWVHDRESTGRHRGTAH